MTNAPRIMIKAPRIMIKAPRMMTKAPRIMIRAPHIMTKAPRITMKAPRIMIKAPRITIKALHIMIFDHLRQLWLSIVLHTLLLMNVTVLICGALTFGQLGLHRFKLPNSSFDSNMHFKH